MSEKAGTADERVVATNRKALHDYEIEETYEAGLELAGSEVKSIRAGRVNLRDSYAKPVDGELWLYNCHIAAYDPASRYGHDPERPRRLLLHRAEIRRLSGKVQERGFTLVPLRLYFKRSRVKVALALAKGRKVYDRREAIARREAEREMERALRRGT
ncbi:MAG: SsrA-binding protein SmpB [Chloroflexi bacterium]|nr:SsrA-binding protein SmpB [Chloroflexota bacterium]